MVLFAKERVLVPFDFSDESIQALRDSLEFVENPGNVHVLHVLHPLEVTEPGVIWNTVNDESRRDNVKKAFSQEFGEALTQGLHFHIVLGDPSAEIIDFARNHQIQLIVISSHGRTGLSRFLLGSVAEKVVRHSPCPVLVLRQ